jgi:N-acetylglucosamine malate deacetylase 2
MDRDPQEPSGSPALHAMALLADPLRRPIDASGWRIVVAHPDDETLGIGSQLHRLHGARLVLVTDGAPRRGSDARDRGFADAGSYALARRTELQDGLAAGGAADIAVERFDIPDQEAALDLPGLTRAVARCLEGADVVLTHAFEGGHPDHDAVAFAVHHAVAPLDAASRPGVIEMPYYRRAADGAFVTQSFEPVPGYLPVQLALTPDEVERKRSMMAAHCSQATVLAAFDPRTERFREAPACDFARLPNKGSLWYERFDCGIDGRRWLDLAAAAREEIAGASGAAR